MSSSNIPLEGRTRLPGKVQDCIQDCGLIATHVQAASRSNENLQKLDALLNTMDVQCMSMSNKSTFRAGREYWVPEK